MKRVLVSALLICCLFSFLVNVNAYAQYGGYFLQGFAEGLQNGIDLGLKMKALKLQKEAIELQKKQLELLKELEYLQEESNKINLLLNIGMNQSDVKSAIAFDLLYEDSSQIIYNNNQEYLVVCLFFENQLIAWDFIASRKETFLFDMLVEMAELEKEKSVKQASRENYYKPFKSSYLDQLKINCPELEDEAEEKSKDKGSILKFNPFCNTWEYAKKDEVLKYNVFENDWEYTDSESQTKYNVFENKWEFAIPDDQIKLNPFENKWSYESKNSTIKYNPFENKWEYTKPGSNLMYNPFEDSWGYE